MPGPDKSELRTRLHRFMITHHLKVPSFICNKLGKLVVDIGRLDWPHFYPDFFVNIHQVLSYLLFSLNFTVHFLYFEK